MGRKVKKIKIVYQQVKASKKETEERLAKVYDIIFTEVIKSFQKKKDAKR